MADIHTTHCACLEWAKAEQKARYRAEEEQEEARIALEHREDEIDRLRVELAGVRLANARMAAHVRAG